MRAVCAVPLCSTSIMYTQTAAMLESCAHAAMRADGPALATQGVALLAERLGAVARLRAAHCVRSGECPCSLAGPAGRVAALGALLAEGLRDGVERNGEGSQSDSKQSAGHLCCHA